MRRTKALAAASLCLVLGVAGCGGNQEDSEEEIVTDLSETLQAGDPDLDREEAECIAEIVVEEVGVEEAQDIVPADAEPTDEQQTAVATATITARDECELSTEG